jgi:hypothetical protein
MRRKNAEYISFGVPTEAKTQLNQVPDPERM